MFKKNHNNTGTTTGHSKAKGIAMLAGGLPVLLLALAAWAVALAGISVIRHEVGENSVQYGDLGYTWFVIFFNLFVLLLVAAYLLGVGIGKLPIGSAAVAGLLAVSTVLTILLTDVWNTTRKAVGRDTKAGKGATTLFAGWISLAVLNGLLILIVGNQIDSRRAATGSTTTTTHYAQPVGTHPTGMAPATATTTQGGVNVV